MQKLAKGKHADVQSDFILKGSSQASGLTSDRLMSIFFGISPNFLKSCLLNSRTCFLPDKDVQKLSLKDVHLF